MAGGVERGIAQDQHEIQRGFDQRALGLVIEAALCAEVDRLGGDSQAIIDDATAAWQKQVSTRRAAPLMEDFEDTTRNPGD